MGPASPLCFRFSQREAGPQEKIVRAERASFRFAAVTTVTVRGVTGHAPAHCAPPWPLGRSGCPLLHRVLLLPIITHFNLQNLQMGCPWRRSRSRIGRVADLARRDGGQGPRGRGTPDSDPARPARAAACASQSGGGESDRRSHEPARRALRYVDAATIRRHRASEGVAQQPSGAWGPCGPGRGPGLRRTPRVGSGVADRPHPESLSP